MNEIYKESSEIPSESITLSDTEIMLLDDSENLNSETTETAETLVSADSQLDILTNIYNDVHIIMVLAILSFAMSCMRGWRKNTLKGC